MEGIQGATRLLWRIVKKIGPKLRIKALELEYSIHAVNHKARVTTATHDCDTLHVHNLRRESSIFRSRSQNFWRGPRRYIHMRKILEGIDVEIRPGLIQHRLCVCLEVFEHRQRDRDTRLACRGIQAIKLLREA